MAADWRARLDARVLYANEHYLTLVQRPRQGGVGWLDRIFRATRADDSLQRDDLRRLRGYALKPDPKILTQVSYDMGRFCQKPADLALCEFISR